MIDRDRLVRTFCDLVRIDSPSGEEEAVAQDLSRRLTHLGFQVARDRHGNVIASEEGNVPLVLSAHMDTVEPGRGISPRVVDNRVESDGTTILGGDCKAGIAAILEALESAPKVPGRAPVQLVFTRGEEIGLIGARNLDFSLIKGREAVVFDGNGPVRRITTGSPTYIAFDVQIKGRAAHAGVEPEKGLSAIRIAADIITQLPQGRIDAETTVNVGSVTGGTVRNAVPEDARFSGEFRSRNPATLEAVRGRVLGVFEAARRQYPEASIREELHVEFEMYSMSPSDPLVARVTEVLNGLGMEAELGPSGGGTDANVLNLHGVRSVVVGISTQGMHTVREFVPVPDLVDAARFCEALVVGGRTRGR